MEEHQDLIYQQSEVLWAKIRGYPWWPAYVSDVHEGDTPSAYQYTVIFFGDNTNSRLGPAKLRKFPEHYSQCYLKAKTNKKLKDSIQKAQQRLSENQQDVSIYENIRSELNHKRKKGTVSQSRLSSSEKGEALEAPDLTKHKTQQPSRSRKNKQIRRDIQIFEQQSQSSKSYSNRSQLKKSANHANTQGRGKRNSKRAQISKRSPPKHIQVIPAEQQTPENRRKRVMRSKQIIESPPVEKERYQIRSNQKSRQKIIKESIPPKQQKQQSQQQQSEKEEVVARPTPPKRRGRKGRPPKNQQLKVEKHKFLKQIQYQNESSQEQPEVVQEGKRNRKKLRAITHQPLSTSKNSENENKNPSESGTLTDKESEKIKKSLNNRKELTKILLDMPINTSNIKQILDLGASLALQDGPITKNIHLLLSTLKATLLHKYFPDNSKHRKKYEKMTKQKRKAVQHSEEDENEDNQENNSEDENKNAGSEQRLVEKQKVVRAQKSKRSSSNKQNKNLNNNQRMVDEGQDDKLKEIRVKANLKLEKMIRRAGINEHARQYATKIENTFQPTAQAKGDLYRNIAYQRMRNLKTKLSQFSESKIHANEVRAYLEEMIQTYQAEAPVIINMQ